MSHVPGTSMKVIRVKKNQQRQAEAARTISAAQPQVDVRARRSVLIVMMITGGLLLGFTFSNAFLGEADRTLALPIRLELLGLGSQPIGGVWLEKLEFSLPESQFEKIQGVNVQIGGQKWAYTKDQFLKEWQITETQKPGQRREDICREVSTQRSGRAVQFWHVSEVDQLAR